MIKSLSMRSLLPVALIFGTCSFVSLEQQLACRSNGCKGCCNTSDLCSTEHTLTSEVSECRGHNPPPPPETPLIPGLQLCPFDFLTLEYKGCPNSRVDDRTKSVGEYGKPNWVGAEFQSIIYDSFSMTVMWEHPDAEMLSTLPNLSPVQGYEIRIYKKEAGRPETVTHCVCVTNSSMRNISDIHSSYFTYRETSHMIVEVRSFPSLIGEDERNTWRNCSLLTGCSKTEDCHDDCYSWPQSCLSFLPYYDPLTCAPPLYSPPVNVIAEMSLVDDDVTDSVSGKLNLSWEPPRMNYELFPVPNIYYITIESAGSIFQFIKAVGTTNVTILHLNSTSIYRIFIRAYVPCSGLGWTIWQGNAGCGLVDILGTEVTVVGDCAPPTPPLHGLLGNYQSTSLHSTVTFQCDSGWLPDELFTTTCRSTDRLEWVPDPVNHTCSGMLALSCTVVRVKIKGTARCLYNVYTVVTTSYGITSLALALIPQLEQLYHGWAVIPCTRC